MAYRPGPGLLVTAAFLGPGTLATATVAGATHRYGLLWVIPLAVVVAFVLQELAARATVATGTPLARLLSTQGPGPAARPMAWAAVGAVVLGAGAFQAGNLTGAALGLEALAGSPRVAWVVAVADVAFLLLWFGRYEALETVLSTLVVLMAGAFGLQVALAGIDVGAALQGLVPRLGAADLGLVLALLGTTVVPYNLFLHTSAVSADRARDDPGPGAAEAVREVRLDLGVSLLLGGLVTASVLLASAGAIPFRRVDGVAEMAGTLGAVVGPLAEGAFATGLLAAGLTSALTAPMAAAWAVDQLRGRSGERPPRLVWVPVLLVGTTIALLPLEPVELIVTAQVANGLVLPLLAAALLWVANRPALGAWRNGVLANLVGLAALVGTALLALGLWL